MLTRIRSGLTYANTMATLALFVALGGGAYAAIRLPANSVGSKQLRNKAVTPKKVAPRTVALFKGEKGVPGPIGPSNAYFNVSTGTNATVSVPAGDYAVFGTMEFEALGGGGSAGCSVAVNNVPLSSTMSSGDEGEDVTGSQAASASDQAVAHLSAPGTISNSCLTSSTVIQHNAITAIKVGTATP